MKISKPIKKALTILFLGSIFCSVFIFIYSSTRIPMVLTPEGAKPLIVIDR